MNPKIKEYVELLHGKELTFIPFLGWVGGVLTIIGGSLYLATLKNFKNT